MKKNVFFIGVLAVTLASCSSDDALQEMQNGCGQDKKIDFTTSLSAMTRGVTTISNMNSFSIDGYLVQNDSVYHYINSAVVSKNANNQWTCATDYYWPRSGEMTFFSVYPQTLAKQMPTGAAITAPTFTYLCPSDRAQQVDVLYAVTKKDCAAAYNSTLANSTYVDINFRHALSQITFNVKNQHQGWVVYVSDVTIANANSSGTYKMPLTTTAAGSENRGSWTLGTDVHDYLTQFGGLKTATYGEKVQLTDASKALLLLPQTRAAWNPKTDPTCANKGSYLLVKCRIVQKTAAGDIQLWPKVEEQTERNIAIPLNIQWNEGHKYVYTITFDDGAGYIPPTETGGGDPLIPGDPALSKIGFNVTVDAYNENGDEVPVTTAN